jgi:sporulation protein YlmC with PRC-barrel domain
VAERTAFTIGAPARCSDGPCGEVSRIVIDPAARAVTHLVIDPGRHRGPGRLVPVHLVDTAGGGIALRCTLAEFGHLDAAEVAQLVEGVPAGGFGPGGMDSPLGIPHPVQTVAEDVVPLGESELLRGERVHAVDGEIGQVHGFVVDPGDHRVTHVLLKEGHLWGRKEVAIPISAVRGVANGIVLNLTKKQVAELPALGQ